MAAKLRKPREGRAGADPAGLLDRFFSGSGGAEDGPGPDFVSARKAWLPEGGLPGPILDARSLVTPAQAMELLGLSSDPGLGGDGPAEGSDARRLAAFVLTDEESLRLLVVLGRAAQAEAADSADRLLGRFEAGTDRPLSAERRQALRALLTTKGPDFATPITRLGRQAERTLTLRELMSTLAQTRFLYERFFPEFYRALPVRLSFRAGANSGGLYRVSTDGPVEIELEGHHLPVPGREEPRILTPFGGTPRMAGHLVRLVTAFHEYAHALFYERTGSKPDSRNGYTALDAVSEGFAVTLELLMIDKALAAREELDLSDADVQDLRTWKRGRFAILRRRDHYTEGTLRFWHGIFKKGGEAAVLSTLDSLSPERLQSVPVGHPAFFLAGGETRLAGTFSRDSPLWEGWLALGKHLADGSPLEDASRDAALSAFGLVRPAALTRFFEASLNTRRPNVLSRYLMSSLPISTLIRLAALSASAAESLVGFLLECLPRVGPSFILARGPAWMEAFIQALVILPMTDAQRSDMRRIIETWASDRISGEKPALARRAAFAGLAAFASGTEAFRQDLRPEDGSRVAPESSRPARLKRSESGYLGPGSTELGPYEGPKGKRAGTTLLNFPTFHRAPLSHPLETFGLYNCAALVIVDRRQGRHFMAHVTEDMPARALKKVLREEGISWADAEIFILPGTDSGTKRTVRHIRAALAGLDKAASGKVRFVHLPFNPGGKATLSIISHDGKVFTSKTGRLGSFKLGGKYFQGVFPR